jgi:hypothetical protein
LQAIALTQQYKKPAQRLYRLIGPPPEPESATAPLFESAPAGTEFIDRVLVCDNCYQEFLFSAEEQVSFAKNQSVPPRRCKSCETEAIQQVQESEGSAPVGRPAQYANPAEKQAAYRARLEAEERSRLISAILERIRNSEWAKFQRSNILELEVQFTAMPIEELRRAAKIYETADTTGRAPTEAFSGGRGGEELQKIDDASYINKPNLGQGPPKDEPDVWGDEEVSIEIAEPGDPDALRVASPKDYGDEEKQLVSAIQVLARQAFDGNRCALCDAEVSDEHKMDHLMEGYRAGKAAKERYKKAEDLRETFVENENLSQHEADAFLVDNKKVLDAAELAFKGNKHFIAVGLSIRLDKLKKPTKENPCLTNHAALRKLGRLLGFRSAECSRCGKEVMETEFRNTPRRAS